MSSRSADLCDGDHEEEEEEGEGCVPIPELPSGRKLTVVILTTWGDQYYVGLNSIEVFTASGEMADIQKVSFCNQAAIFCRQKPKHTQCIGQILALNTVMFPLAQISADPADINVLPEYSNDPRVVQNLLDGVNQTRDDLHMWLAPFSPGRPHTVSLTFTSPTTLAMVRIWVSIRTCSQLFPSYHLSTPVWIEFDFVM